MQGRRAGIVDSLQVILDLVGVLKTQPLLLWTRWAVPKGIREMCKDEGGKLTLQEPLVGHNTVLNLLAGPHTVFPNQMSQHRVELWKLDRSDLEVVEEGLDRRDKIDVCEAFLSLFDRDRQLV